MQVSEMIEYLQTFPEDALVSFIVADIKERVIYTTKKLIGLTDAPNPTFCLDIGDPEPFTEEEKKIAEECEKDA